MSKNVNLADPMSPTIATLLGEIFSRMTQELPPEDWHGLRQSHLRVITSIEREGSRITDLAERLRMTKQGAGQLVTTLIEAGLVRVERGERDGRVRLVRRTAEGDRLVEQLQRRFAVLEAAWAEEVGAADYAAFRRVTERLAGRAR